LLPSLISPLPVSLLYLPLALTPWRNCCGCRRRIIDATGSCCLREHAMVRCKRMPQRFTQVAQQMPAISYLNGARNCLARRFGIDAAAVTAHDLYTGMLPQPSSHGRRLSIRQQVDDPALLQIAEYGAVAMALLPCPVIDPKHTRRCYSCSSGSMMQMAEQSRSAGQQSEPACQPCSGPAT